MPFEAEQILLLPLPSQPQSDRLIWGPDKNGIFTVKSAYHFMRKFNDLQRSNQAEEAHKTRLWSKLWNFLVIPHYKHLAWRILHQKLPVRSLLFKKGVRYVPTCLRCDEVVETISHTFKDCYRAKFVWFLCPSGIHFVTGGEASQDFVEWLESIILKAPAEVGEFVLPLTYGIWLARNKKCYENIDISLQQIIQKAWSSVSEFKASIGQGIVTENGQRQQPKIRWMPPPTSWFKVNVDAVGPREGIWGAGIIIRDENGRICASTSMQFTSMDNATLAEAMALCLGMQLALDLSIPNVQAETDSLQIAQTMKSFNSGHSYIGMIISDCCNISQSIENFVFLHTKREANQVAHSLAKFALLNPDHIWFEETPDCISEALALDLLPSFVD